MPIAKPLFRLRSACLPAILALALGVPAIAQDETDEFVTGKAAAAWRAWQTAMDSLIARDAETAEFSFDQLLAGEPSPLRIALLADRSVRRNVSAGGVLLLEQDAAAGSLGESGKRVAEMLETGREQMNEADDGWYFASIGQFGIANANFTALLGSDPDPVALLEFADMAPRRTEILVKLSDHPIMGAAAVGMLRQLRIGEQRIKADPTRIKQHIERLDGPPRAFENGVAHLKESGEYAIPFMIQFLRDSTKSNLTQPILRTLPLIGRAGLNPLVIALRTSDQAVQQYIIQALGRIGYSQAAPYLLKLRDDAKTPPDVRAAATAALDALIQKGVNLAPGLTAAEAYYLLAEEYYDDRSSLAADATLDMANVWYWRDELLENVEVPTAIFNEIMTMRCCEEALMLDPDLKPALSLWLAANFRREAQLPEGQRDYTRPADYPPASYFAESAGAEYCQLALARAVDDRDPAVALGTIEALRKTAGTASLLNLGGGRQPLAEALSFPDRMVRVRAALALGGSLPDQQFSNSQNLMPMLAETLQLYAGASNALVVDADEEVANALTTALRTAGYQAISSASLFDGLEKARTELAGVDVILLAADTTEPALPEAIDHLRSEFRFASTPVLVIVKPTYREAIQTLARSQPGIGMIAPGVDQDTLKSEIASISRSVGATPITAELGKSLALEAALVLGELAGSNSPLFRLEEAQPALLAAFGSGDADLRIAVARALAQLATAEAQSTIAAAALLDTEEQVLRVAMFSSLAESGKRNGLLLGDEQVQQLVRIAENAEDMVIRQAAAEAQGALNLPGNPASAIIRNQYGG